MANQLVILLIFSLVTSSHCFLNEKELEISLALVKKLEIRHCIFASTDKTISQIKEFSSRSIPTTYFTYDQISGFVYDANINRNIDINIGIIFKEKDLFLLTLISEHLAEKVREIAGGTYVQPNSMNWFTWIIFLENWNSSYQNRLLVPYDCEFLIIQNNKDGTYNMTEFYKAKNSSFYYDFGKWDGDLKATNTSFYYRRLNLNGVVLNNYHVPEAKFCERSKNIRTPITSSCVVHEIVQCFSQMMNYTSLQIEMTTYKYYLDNDIATNVIPMLSRADLRQVIGPLFKVNTHWFVARPRGGLQPDYFLKPFETKIWLILLGCMAVGTILIVVMHVFPKNPRRYITDNLFMSFEIFCNQNGNDEMEAISLRIVCLSLNIIAIAIFNSFGAVITSFLAVEVPHIPFTNAEEFIRNGQYKLLTGHSPEVYRWLESEIENSGSTKPYDHYVEFASAEEFVKNYKRICHENIVLDGFIGDCNVIQIPKPINFHYAATHAGISSSFSKVFNQNVIRLDEYGILRHWRLNVISAYMTYVESTEENLEPIEIQQMVQVLLIPIFGILAALMVITGEFVYMLLKNRNS